MPRILDVLAQALPGLQHLAAVGTGHAPRVNVVGLDVKLNVFLHLRGLAALAADPALHGVPVHQSANCLVKILKNNNMKVNKKQKAKKKAIYMQVITSKFFF